MVKTIGNPGTWLLGGLGGTARHASETMDRIAGDETGDPVVQRISTDDLRHALRKGVEDFTAARADVMAIVLFYPVIGALLAAVALHANLLHYLFPIAAGFVLLGPVAAVGLYEISRRREAGEDVNWTAALSLIGRPRFGAIIVLGLYLTAIFLIWIAVAGLVYQLTLGPEPPLSVGTFLSDVFTTGAGWAMIVFGVAIGFLFAFAVLAMSVVSFPLLLDRRVGVPKAIATSIEVTRKNPREVLTWGFIVALGLFLGSIPLFIGLIFVLPILGHATWHLYRRAVS